MTKKFVVVTVGVVLLVVLGSGAFLINSSGQLVLTFSGAIPVAAARTEEQEITIVMGDASKGEFTFTPDVVKLKNGEETKLIFKNAGKLTHEFMSVFLSSHWAKVLMKINGVETGVTFHELELEPGQQAMIMVIPQVPDHVLEEKGGQIEFEFGCFIKDHYKAGMKGTFIVEGQ